jgi:type IV secretion system protein TrbB
MVSLREVLEKMDMASTPMLEPVRIDNRIEEKFLRELGPIVRRELENELTEDICLNSDGRIWVKRRGSGFQHIGEMMEFQALMLIGTVAYMRENRVVNSDTPILEVDLPIFKSRFEAIVPPVVIAPIFAIRGRAKYVPTIANYMDSGIISHKDDPLNARRRREDRLAKCHGLNHGEIFELAVRERWNILVAGSTGSGKTTLCNALLEAQKRLTPHHRTILIEDTPELNCEVENFVAMLSSAKTSMLDCLKATMRLKPDRISVGEVRGGEALTLLKSWNTGHPGGFATLHADDAYGALQRLQSLVAEATPAPQEEFIAKAVNLVIHIDGDPDLPQGRKVKEVCLVNGFGGGVYQVDYI